MSKIEKELIGSIVKVNPPFLNDKVGNREPITGELQFLGTNKYLGWELQVTVDRTPYQIKSISQLELIS